MVRLEIRHRVDDYDVWKKVFDTFPPTAAGARSYRVCRGVDDAREVLVVGDFPSAEAARAFQGNEDLKAKMAEAGVAGAPRFEYYDEVERGGA